MQQQINPKTVAILIGVLVIVVLVIGYRVLFTGSQTVHNTPKPGFERMMHPRGPDNPGMGAGNRPGYGAPMPR